MRSELDRIALARRSLEKARKQLLHPTVQALETGALDIARAVEELQRVESGLRLGGRRAAAAERALHAEIGGLRRDVTRVSELLEGAGKFYQGWARLMSCAADNDAANYTHEGKAADRPAASRMAVIHG